MQVEVRAVETFADLLFAVDADDGAGSFYDRLCEAACTLAEMDRSVVFLYDSALRRVRVVGSHGISIDEFRDLHVQVDSAPLALRALREDRVLEATPEDFAELLPPSYVRFLGETRLVCTPIAAAGRWPGVILSDRAIGRPLTPAESHLLWSLGKIAALADSARIAAREHERARQLQGQIDLAREIHEGVVQRLFGVSLALSGADLPPEQLRRCAAEIQEALADLRRALQRPLGRPPREIGTTIADEAQMLAEERPDIRVTLEPTGDADARVPEHLRSLAGSVLREALRNALKHAEPTWIAIRVERDGAFALEVRNDGVRDTGSRRAGMGLRLAAVEALEHGGVVEFGESEPGQWRVRLLVPVEDDA